LTDEPVGAGTRSWSSTPTTKWSVTRNARSRCPNTRLAGSHFGIAAYQTALASGLRDGPTANVTRAPWANHVKQPELLTEQAAARDGIPVAALSAEGCTGPASRDTAAETVTDTSRGCPGSARPIHSGHSRRPGMANQAPSMDHPTAAHHWAQRAIRA
jgi:hypothetical protein